MAGNANSFCSTSLGFGNCAQKGPFLVRGGDPCDEVAELTEESCSSWMSTIDRAKLMVIYFMGEGDGRLSMQPFDEESDEVTIATEPDMMVILRADSMHHRHISSTHDFALVSYILTGEAVTTRGWQGTISRGYAGTVPTNKELYEWAQNRLQELTAYDADEKLEMDDIPREWQLMLRHSYFRNNHNPVAVRGEAGHMPSTHSNQQLWESFNVGTDFVTTVPLSRWDHSQYYDADPNSYQQAWAFRPAYHPGNIRTSINHGQFIEGVDLFDNKFFGVSAMETKGMDPMQRHILETSYEALYNAGYTKKSLMGQYIAVFTGCANPEWNYIDKEAGACSGTGSSQAITSNRTSFLLGVMGPSTSIDCEMSSAGMALILGGTAVSPNNQRRTESGGDSTAAIVGGVFLQMTPFMWPRFNASMNPVGRCFSFDQNANGYVRGECCGSVALKPYAEKVDDKLVIAEDQPCVGTLTGWRMTNNGRSAGLCAPSGPAEQEAIYESIRHAGISPLDLDAMECHTAGSLLADGVETASALNVLRGCPGGDKEPLIMGSCKTNVGAQMEACCMTSFLKVIFSIAYANNVPSNHLNQLNPHIETGEAAFCINSEALAYRDARAFHGVGARGMGGSNVNLVVWYYADGHRVPMGRPEMQRSRFSYWPGGGGILESEYKASEGYYIVGSWSEWDTPYEMARQKDGSFTQRVTLGENCFEAFQIWLDGDRDKVLHPDRPGAPAGSGVFGPSTRYQSQGYNWLIDGRDKSASSSAVVSTGETPSFIHSDGVPNFGFGGAAVDFARDQGSPGDQYEVKLMVSGKYRAVTWSKVQDHSQLVNGIPNSMPTSALGSYYVSASWNGWTLDEMIPSEEEPGVYSLKVGPLRNATGEFRIIRNKDFDQVFYPPESHFSSLEEGRSSLDIAGPIASRQSLGWRISSQHGNIIRIEFRRIWIEGKETRQISWNKV
eukprot:TRINITY_DN27528_c0_g1_i1.p1 TRINITY_DN27528_c0_g1~~TRINITY_DN27528_c0_g1_i1.p1  ORF type:complete len:1048 (-),score=162.23 TRINITY_DN27528_c0_g1_i1:128-2983(-)